MKLKRALPRRLNALGMEECPHDDDFQRRVLALDKAHKMQAVSVGSTRSRRPAELTLFQFPSRA